MLKVKPVDVVRGASAPAQTASALTVAARNEERTH